MRTTSTIGSLVVLLLMIQSVRGQDVEFSPERAGEATYQFLGDIRDFYAYLPDREIDLDQLREHYEGRLGEVGDVKSLVLFLEDLVYEFRDSHMILNTHVDQSYRIYGPIFSETKGERTQITQVWQSQLAAVPEHLIGAEVLRFNGQVFADVIDGFSSFDGQSLTDVDRTWIGNKILAGRYSEPRVVGLKLADGRFCELDLDQLQYRNDSGLLDVTIENDFGIIRIHDSLGDSDLIEAFDLALHEVGKTRGLILDLRNTISGGDSYVARAIMGRFLDSTKAYQRHWRMESYGGHTPVERVWIEYVSPRPPIYEQPLVVLVSRWTGSMGEGLAVGFDAIGAGKIVGTEMRQLAGAINQFRLRAFGFGYQFPTEKLFHVDGTPRESFRPEHYVDVVSSQTDPWMETAFQILDTGSGDSEPEPSIH